MLFYFYEQKKKEKDNGIEMGYSKFLVFEEINGYLFLVNNINNLHYYTIRMRNTQPLNKNKAK